MSAGYDRLLTGQAFFVYCKINATNGNPVDLVDIENGFRAQNMMMHLIAKASLCKSWTCLTRRRRLRFRRPALWWA